MMKHEKSELGALEGFSIVSVGFRQDVFCSWDVQIWN